MIQKKNIAILFFFLRRKIYRFGEINIFDKVQAKKCFSFFIKNCDD